MQIAEYHKKITSLGSRDITVRVMTPDGYESGAKRYPVVYINDGQDVFRDEDILWGSAAWTMKITTGPMAGSCPT